MTRRPSLEEFVVVVIDDKEESRRRVCDAIQGNRKLDDRDVRVIVNNVLVKVKQLEYADPLLGKRWTFEAEVADQLARAAEARPDMIIVDFVYIDRAVQSEIVSHINENGTATENKRELYLNPRDLRVWVENCNSISAAIRKNILRNIFDSSVPTFLHTYTPESLEDATGKPEVRKGIADFAFPNAKNLVELVDTREIFYSGNAFDPGSGKSFYRPDHYGHMLGLHFSHLVDKQIYRKHIYEKKYLRVKNSAMTISTIVCIGTCFAAATSLIGGVLFEYLKKGDVVEAVIIFVGSVISSAVLGGMIGLLFERLMRNLLPPAKEDR